MTDSEKKELDQICLEIDALQDRKERGEISSEELRIKAKDLMARFLKLYELNEPASYSMSFGVLN